jgi:dihydroorotate dehydrogenase (NAD+) catalytic subunit
LLAYTYGGLSGPCIKPIALRMVLEAARTTSIPIVAAGGVSSIDDVMEFLVAGASAVQVGTANFYDPGVSMRLLDQLPASLASLGADSVRAVVGTLETS